MGKIEEMVTGWGFEGCERGESGMEVSERGRGLRGGVDGKGVGEW